MLPFVIGESTGLEISEVDPFPPTRHFFRNGSSERRSWAISWIRNDVWIAPVDKNSKEQIS